MESNIFYRLPKALLKDDKYNCISLEAKILYCIMLDRASLSKENGWLDDDGRVFIYFTIEEAVEMIGVGATKCVRMFKELEKNGLIIRKRQGQGRPVMIYVSDFSKTEVKTFQKQKSRVLKNESLDFSKTQSNNTNINNTNYSYTEPTSSCDGEGEDGEVAKMDALKESVKNQIEYDVLCETCHESELLPIVNIMTEVIASKNKIFEISGQEIPSAIVKKKMFSLNGSHIEYTLDFMHENKAVIKNVKKYITSVLYNAPESIEAYYVSRTNRDME